jgi:hypothetical protein
MELRFTIHLSHFTNKLKPGIVQNDKIDKFTGCE